MDMTSRKGTECIFKPMLCQEGYCVDCQIAIDAGNDPMGIVHLNRLEDAAREAEKRRRLLEWRLNFNH